LRSRSKARAQASQPCRALLRLLRPAALPRPRPRPCRRRPWLRASLVTAKVLCVCAQATARRVEQGQKQLGQACARGVVPNGRGDSPPARSALACALRPGPSVEAAACVGWRLTRGGAVAAGADGSDCDHGRRQLQVDVYRDGQARRHQGAQQGNAGGAARRRPGTLAAAACCGTCCLSCRQSLPFGGGGCLLVASPLLIACGKLPPAGARLHAVLAPGRCGHALLGRCGPRRRRRLCLLLPNEASVPTAVGDGLRLQHARDVCRSSMHRRHEGASSSLRAMGAWK
jgi:hypothetical protein